MFIHPQEKKKPVWSLNHSVSVYAGGNKQNLKFMPSVTNKNQKNVTHPLWPLSRFVGSFDAASVKSLGTQMRNTARI